jgi:hypothetical protein
MQYVIHCIDVGDGNITGRKTAGVASRRSLIPRHNHQAPSLTPLRSLSSAAFLAATSLLTTTSLLATTALFFALALLAATGALFVTITLFVAIALLAATVLLAAFLSGSLRFDRFVRIVLCFHSVFLYFSY